MDTPAERMKKSLFLTHWRKLKPEQQTEQSRDEIKMMLASKFDDIDKMWKSPGPLPQINTANGQVYKIKTLDDYYAKIVAYERELGRLVIQMQEDLQHETRILEGTPIPTYKPYTDEEFKNELSSSQIKQNQ